MPVSDDIGRDFCVLQFLAPCTVDSDLYALLGLVTKRLGGEIACTCRASCQRTTLRESLRGNPGSSDAHQSFLTTCRSIRRYECLVSELSLIGIFVISAFLHMSVMKIVFRLRMDETNEIVRISYSIVKTSGGQ